MTILAFSRVVAKRLYPLETMRHFALVKPFTHEVLFDPADPMTVDQLVQTILDAAIKNHTLEVTSTEPSHEAAATMAKVVNEALTRFDTALPVANGGLTIVIRLYTLDEIPLPAKPDTTAERILVHELVETNQAH